MQDQQEEFVIPGSFTNSRIRDRVGCELVAEALRLGGAIRIRVTGTSMLPAIWPGDVLLVAPSHQDSITTRQIVLFLRDGRLFAHRVVGRNGLQLITRGDAVPDCNPPVSPSEVLGVVTGIVRGRGAEAQAIQSVIAAGPLSLGQRIVAFAVRHSHLAYRIVLKWHSLSRWPSGVSGWSGTAAVPRHKVAGE